MKLNDIEKADFTWGKVVKWGVVAFVAFGALGIAGSYLGLFTKAVTAPAAVASRTLDTDNIINNYNWFFRVNGNYDTYVGNIKNFKQLAANEPDVVERGRLRIELAGMQNICRDTVNQYNNRSVQLNASIFKDWRLPEQLYVGGCE